MVVDSSSLLAKYLDEKDGNSLKFMQRMIYLIFSEVVYQRELLPQEHFTEKNILGCKLHIPNPTRDSRQRALHHHLKGAAEAIEGKRLKQYHLMVHKDRYDPSAADEVFIMDVVYAENDDDEASMQMSCGEQQSEVRVCYTGVEQLQKQTKEVFRSLVRGLSTLDRITRNVSFSFYIMYRDGVDRAYHPTGYVQPARRYALPDTAEIGDMGMVHAKEHACLLKVKSMLLEDGFQLMQRNAATQRTDTQPQQSVPMEEGEVSSCEVMSTEKYSSLGVFASPHGDEWAETPEETPARTRDQRSTTGGAPRAARDQRSLTAASAKTARFGESVSVLDLSMHSDDGLNAGDDNDFAASDDEEEEVPARAITTDEEEQPSEDLGTATQDDFAPTPKTSQTRIEGGEEGEEGGTQHTRASTFTSTISMVTKKLMEKDERKEEKMRDDEEKEKEAAASVAASSVRSSHSDSAVDAGSEASEEKTPAAPPARRVSLRKRKSLPKVPEESSTTGSSDERPSAEATAEDAVITAAPKQSTSGSNADAESSAKKETRRTTARRKASRERQPATLAEETVETPEKEAETPTTKRAARPQRGGRKTKDTVAEDTVVPETPQETVQSDSQSTGRRGRSGGRAVMEKEEEVKEKKEVKRGGRGRGRKAAEESEKEVEEESSDSREASSGGAAVEVKVELEQQQQQLPTTPRGRKRPAEAVATPVKKTPGEAIKRPILYSKDFTKFQ